MVMIIVSYLMDQTHIHDAYVTSVILWYHYMSTGWLDIKFYVVIYEIILYEVTES